MSKTKGRWIGNRIATIRTTRGISQSALARLCRVSQSAISQIESGDRCPSFDMLERLAVALSVSLPVLVTRSKFDTISPRQRAAFRRYAATLPRSKRASDVR